jgi:ACR3 family arsenite efflux pump ArsB
MGAFERFPSLWVALATVAGVLVEVPVMLSLLATANRHQRHFPEGNRFSWPAAPVGSL